jgi:glucose-1-phosphate adenylyltransferase
MNYRELIQTHRESKADATIAALPVSREAAKSFGIMRIDHDGRVVGFVEKPQTEQDLDLVRMEPHWIDARGIDSRGRDCLANMGVYVFNRSVLEELLLKTDYRDFGKEIFPTAIRSKRVQVHLFDGYWEDVGTIKSYYDSSLSLASANPPFNLASAEAPIYSRPEFLPPTQIQGAQVKQSLIADGCRISEGAVIENSIIGLRCLIGPNVTIRNSIVLGADAYESDGEIVAAQRHGMPPIGIGEGSLIVGSILDKNCRVGRGVATRTTVSFAMAFRSSLRMRSFPTDGSSHDFFLKFDEVVDDIFERLTASEHRADRCSGRDQFAWPGNIGDVGPVVVVGVSEPLLAGRG